jgi:hypothetical protein
MHFCELVGEDNTGSSRVRDTDKLIEMAGAEAESI